MKIVTLDFEANRSKITEMSPTRQSSGTWCPVFQDLNYVDGNSSMHGVERPMAEKPGIEGAGRLIRRA